jgi:Transposase DDE domain
VVVPVIEYSLPGSDERRRLITSLLDEHEVPALELAALYHQRWQAEAVFDELKTQLRQQRRTLRSKTPDLVRQEFYGWVLGPLRGAIADQMNGRPRKTVAWHSPLEVYGQWLARLKVQPDAVH